MVIHHWQQPDIGNRKLFATQRGTCSKRRYAAFNPVGVRSNRSVLFGCQGNHNHNLSKCAMTDLLLPPLSSFCSTSLCCVSRHDGCTAAARRGPSMRIALLLSADQGEFLCANPPLLLRRSAADQILAVTALKLTRALFVKAPQPIIPSSPLNLRASLLFGLSVRCLLRHHSSREQNLFFNLKA